MSTHNIPVWMTPRDLQYLSVKNGWASGIYAYEIAPPSTPCVLLFSKDGRRPRVWTEEEVKAAIEAEPELPGDMPDEMWEACKSDRDTMQEAMRIVVRLTKEGIAKELNITL